MEIKYEPLGTGERIALCIYNGSRRVYLEEISPPDLYHDKDYLRLKEKCVKIERNMARVARGAD